MRPSPNSNRFILQTFDCHLGCPVAQTLFHVADLEALRSILGKDAHEDADLRNTYHPDDDQLANLLASFDVKFDRSEFESSDVVVELLRWRPVNEAPYLLHTGYELPLLLDGRKKFARMTDNYPPMTFEGEHRFDHWVAEGLLHKEEELESFDTPISEHLGVRTVYYTPKGEEWRIPASKLIWEASSKAGGWNEYFERLEGMLFGYENWQNDWWIAHRLSQRGAVGGLVFCCTVTLAGLAWIEAAGFRALPPVEAPALTVASYDADAKDDLSSLMLESPDSTALVRFALPGRQAKRFMNIRTHGPWHIGAERISELNKHLQGSVAVVARRTKSDQIGAD